MRNFRNYDIWKNGMDIVDRVYTLSSEFPKYETYGLCDQIRRAAVSIPSNVAEGSSRTSEIEFSRFLEFSIGSCFEVETQLEIARRRDYISQEQFLSLSIMLEKEERQINQFINQLKKNKIANG